MLIASRVDALFERARREVDTGATPSCQVALGYDGELVAFDVYGSATLDSRYSIFSCTKAFVAAACWQLIGRGVLDPNATVATYLAEFAENEKAEVTVEQVMLHTGGFPNAVVYPSKWSTSAGRREAFATWTLDWTPGSRYEYHALSAHWVLAEIIGVLTGRDYKDVVMNDVVRPLGLPRFQLGVPAAEQSDILDVVPVGTYATSEQLQEYCGISEVPGIELASTFLSGLNRTETREVGLPGGGGIATAADLALFYQGLMHDDGTVFEPATLHNVTSVVRQNFPDPVLSIPANRSLGLMIAGSDGLSHRRGFGHEVSARAFGHDGAGGQLAFADPQTGLSFGYVTNGMQANFVDMQQRMDELASLAALCTTPLG